MPTALAGTAWVTGAGSGIGKAIALLLAKRGAHVCCCDLDSAAAESTARQIRDDRGCASAHILDVRSESDWERFGNETANCWGPIKYVVHSAGISAAKPLWETTLEEWRAVMATNLDGAFLATRQAIVSMREEGGVVVHIGSASGLRPAPGAAAYSVSKAGLGMLVRTAAKECRSAGIPIRICAVSPAGVRTPIWGTMAFFQDLVRQFGSEEAAYAAMEKADGAIFSDPIDIASAVGFLLSDEARHIHGVELAVDDGYTL